MKELPLVCKFMYSYKYNGRLKERPMYVLFIEHSLLENAYYVNLIETNGTLHGRHYDRWFKWSEEDVAGCFVPMNDLPDLVLKTAREQLAIYEEVNRRSNKS